MPSLSSEQCWGKDRRQYSPRLFGVFSMELALAPVWGLRFITVRLAPVLCWKRLMVESIYYVISWLCHRQCPHCYEERFRPYRGNELNAVVSEARSNFEKIIDHFPDHMRFRVPEAASVEGVVPEMTGRIILSGGE